MKPGISFQEIEKHYATVMEKSRPYRAPRRLNMITVKGRPGGYLSDVETEVLVIVVKFLIDGETAEILRKNAEDFADWLTTKQPQPLVFSDEPDRTYYAITEGSIDPDELVLYGITDVTFICPDPHKYGMTRTHTFTGDIHTITNKGTADAIPIFKATVNQKITNLDLVMLDAYMRIGSPVSVASTPTDSRTLRMSDEMSSLSGWSVASAVDNGHVAGTMRTDGDGFMADTWGAVQLPAQWQGPSMIKGLPQPIQNFNAEILVEQISGLKEAGMLEIYFRDAAGKVVCKVGVSDEWRDTKMNQVKFQLGDIGERVSLNKTAANPAHWDNYKGMLRVTRSGRKFVAYFSLVDSKGNHTTRASIPFFDSFDDYQTPITTVQVAIRKWPDSDVAATQMKVKKIEVWSVNTPVSNEPVYIAGPGDTIEINHEIGDVLINGEPRIWMKDFGSTFFHFKPGDNYISLSPAYAMNMTVTWRERYV